MNSIIKEIKKLKTEQLEKLSEQIQYLILNRMFPKNKKGERQMKKDNK